jgi:hypothetical protein
MPRQTAIGRAMRNMPSTIRHIIASSPAVEVTPLIALPTSSDPSTWQKGAEPVSAQMISLPSQLPGGIPFSLTVRFPIGCGPIPIVGYAITFEGQLIAVAMLPNPLFAQRSLVAQINGQCNPVQR